MKKFLLTLAIAMTSMFASGQELSYENPTYSKDGVRLELINVQEDGALVKYYSIDIEGNIVQEGHYLNGKPHGEWKMTHPNGNVTTMKFKNGKRIVMNTLAGGKETIVYYEKNKPVKVVTVF